MANWILYMKKTLRKLNKAAFLKYVGLSSINIKISLSLPEPITYLAHEDISMYNECPSASGLIENFANET